MARRAADDAAPDPALPTHVRYIGDGSLVVLGLSTDPAVWSPIGDHDLTGLLETGLFEAGIPASAPDEGGKENA